MKKKRGTYDNWFHKANTGNMTHAIHSPLATLESLLFEHFKAQKALAALVVS